MISSHETYWFSSGNNLFNLNSRNKISHQVGLLTISRDKSSNYVWLVCLFLLQLDLTDFFLKLNPSMHLYKWCILKISQTIALRWLLSHISIGLKLIGCIWQLGAWSLALLFELDKLLLSTQNCVSPCNEEWYILCNKANWPQIAEVYCKSSFALRRRSVESACTSRHTLGFGARPLQAPLLRKHN